MSSPTPTSLVVETLPVEYSDSIVEILSQDSPLLWWKRGEGFIGIEECARYTFSGPSRFTDASALWADIVSTAVVADSVNLRGTGLISISTFAFSDHSPTHSTMIIPHYIVGRTDGVTWFTRIRQAGDPGEILTAVLAQQTITDLMARKATEATPLSFTSDDHDLFTGKVEKALSRIAAGDVEKIVLSRTQRATVSPRFDLRPALRHLAESYPDCWTFSVDGFFGSSPETLINVTGGHFTAKVLAGTAPRGTDSASDTQMASDLASSSKDLDEHGFASRSVYKALDPLVSQLSMSDAPYTLKLPNVWHLASDIAGELSPDVSSLNIVKALHPTAAVAGTPTSHAVTLISEIEGFDRGRYAGPVGWMGANGDGQWAIGLRCAQLFGDHVEAYAGGGIVSDSIPEKEYVETEMKFKPVLEALS